MIMYKKHMNHLPALTSRQESSFVLPRDVGVYTRQLLHAKCAGCLQDFYVCGV